MSIKSIVMAIIRPVVRALPDAWFGEGSDLPPRPGAKSLVVTKYAPTPLNGVMGETSTARMSVTGFPVRLALIISSVGLAVSGHAPALSAHPAPASMVVTGYAPTPVSVPNAAEPAAASLSVRGYAPNPASVPVQITFTHTGATFAALLTVTGTPDILWTFADATTDATASPSKNFGSAATRETTLVVTPWSALTGINIGYGGEDGGSPSITELAQQNVTNVEGLILVANSLELWCSSHNPLTTLDFTNFSALDTVECYQCTSLASVTLTNTAAITRLCLEQCGLSTLDVSDCTGVEDFRAAAQGGGNQPFSITWGVFPNAWHVCVRDNDLTGAVPHANFPHIHELWIWNCSQSGAFSLATDSITSLSINTNAYTSADMNGLVPAGRNATLDFYNNSLTSLDITDCPGIDTLNIRANDFSQATLDGILVTLESFNTSGGTLDLRENVSPSSVGIAAANALAGRSWTITGADAFLPTPGTAGMVVTGYAPVLPMGVPASASLAVRAYSPFVLTPAPSPTTAVLAVTGYAPTLSVMPASSSKVVTGYAPTLAAAGPTLTYIGVHVDESTGRVRTFSGVSIGSAADDRLVVVAVGCGGGENTPVSVSIGGTNGTIHAQGSASGWQSATIASRTVASGTTADIVVTRQTVDGVDGPTVIAVYTITGLASTTPESTDGDSGDPIALTLNVPEGAVMISCAHGGDANSAYTVTGATVDASGVDTFYNYWFGSEVEMAADATYDLTFSRSNPWSGAAAVAWL